MNNFTRNSQLATCLNWLLSFLILFTFSSCQKDFNLPKSRSINSPKLLSPVEMDLLMKQTSKEKKSPDIFYFKSSELPNSVSSFCSNPQGADGCCCIVFTGYAHNPYLWVFFAEDRYDLGSNYEYKFYFKLKYNGQVIYENDYWDDFTDGPTCANFGYGRGVGPFYHCGGEYEVTVQKRYRQIGTSTFNVCSEAVSSFYPDDPPGVPCNPGD
ncbi:MAG: hypothetical protein JNL70_13580 [Saprospiraceae bacterium]|nr:hypothetical protein [Saprospiraceae bacterium]